MKSVPKKDNRSKHWILKLPTDINDWCFTQQSSITLVFSSFYIRASDRIVWISNAIHRFWLDPQKRFQMVQCFVLFFKKKVKLLWFQLLKCDYFLVSVLLCVRTLNVFTGRLSRALGNTDAHISHYFLRVYRLNNESVNQSWQLNRPCCSNYINLLVVVIYF